MVLLLVSSTIFKEVRRPLSQGLLPGMDSQSGSIWHSQQLDHSPDRRCGLLRGSRGCSDKSRSTRDQSLSRSLPRLFASLRSLLNCVVVSRCMDQSTLALRSSRLAYSLSPCPSRACPNACLRLAVTGQRIERRAQLDQGQYGPRLWGSCEDAKRPACEANGRPARVEAAA